MSAQDILMGSHVAHVRELKTEVARLRAENAALHDEIKALKAHFDEALLAAEDLRALPEDGRLEIWDGWNLILGATREAKDRADLFEQARKRLDAGGGRLKIWIVLDGPDENVSVRGDLRVSYTGGQGLHRADTLICDYLRMARYLGLASRVQVRTNDKDFAKAVAKLKA